MSLHLEGVICEGVYTMVGGPAFSLQFCLQVAVSLHLEGVIREGVYTMVGGPNYETVAELNLLRELGVDSVGIGFPLHLRIFQNF